jgi:hypothetical protein
MDRFEHAESRLSSGEIFVIREKGVKLYDGDEKVSFRIKNIINGFRCFGGIVCLNFQGG